MVFIRTSNSYLSTHLEQAIKDDNFFNIDFDKFGLQIIDKSNLPESRKAEIKEMFKDPSKRAPKEEQKTKSQIRCQITKVATNSSTTGSESQQPAKPKPQQPAQPQIQIDHSNLTIQSFNKLPINQQFTVISALNGSGHNFNNMNELLTLLNSFPELHNIDNFL